MSRVVIETRLRGTPQQYFVGKVIANDGTVVHCHTGKSIRYVKRMTDRYKTNWGNNRSDPFQDFDGSTPPKDRD